MLLNNGGSFANANSGGAVTFQSGEVWVQFADGSVTCDFGNGITTLNNHVNNWDTVAGQSVFRITRDGKSGVSWGNALDIQLKKSTHSLNSYTEADFKIAVGATTTPDTIAMTLSANGVYTPLAFQADGYSTFNAATFSGDANFSSNIYIDGSINSDELYLGDLSGTTTAPICKYFPLRGCSISRMATWISAAATLATYSA